ncbi:MAG: DNA-directed RNA polymerase subunit D [Candidatus Altiarchaeota archaeon]|nr:DNA-directed RNA polymerase subunit D [Candidatus Altiarchaeota archaeon]
MKIQTLEKKENKEKFLVKDANYTFLNSIRRVIISDILSMAVEELTVYENSSPLYDELIAKRLGLIPLSTDLKTYSLKEECKCGGEGCARCQVNLILEKVGPGVVYSKDIKSRDPKIKPVYEKIPIVKLGNGQKIRIEMVANLGKGMKHTKFQSAIASYNQINDKDYEFFVESYNNLKPSEIMDEALSILERQIDDFEKAFEESKKPKKVKKTEADEKPKEKKVKAKTAKKGKTGKKQEKPKEKKAKKSKKEVKKKAKK